MGLSGFLKFLKDLNLMKLNMEHSPDEKQEFDPMLSPSKFKRDD